MKMFLIDIKTLEKFFVKKYKENNPEDTNLDGCAFYIFERFYDKIKSGYEITVEELMNCEYAKHLRKRRLGNPREPHVEGSTPEDLLLEDLTRWKDFFSHIKEKGMTDPLAFFVKERSSKRLGIDGWHRIVISKAMGKNKIEIQCQDQDFEKINQILSSYDHFP